MTNEDIIVKNLRVSERLVYAERKMILDAKKQALIGYPTKDRPWEKYYPDYVLNAKLPHMTIYDYVLFSNEHNMDRVALNYFDRKISYKEMFDNIEKTAKALIESGVKKGDIVSIAMPTVPETIYLFYALSKIGAIANMIDPRTSAEGIEHYVSECDSKILFIVDKYAEKAKNIKQNTSVNELFVISPACSLPKVLNYGYKAKSFIESLKEKDNFLKSGDCVFWKDFFERGNTNKVYEYPSYEKDYPVVIVHTGGTTGVAKGVLLSNDNLNAASFQCEVAGFDFKKTHKWLNIMPPFIAYGIGNGLHLPLACGMETILIPEFNPALFYKLLLKYSPEHMVGVPSHYGSIIKNKNMASSDLSYIIAPTVGGDAMKLNLEEETNEFLFNHGCSYLVTKGYGMTEVCAAVSACNANETNKLGSVGIPFPHTTISIFDPETLEELEYGKEGEVCITGPNTMLGYFNNEKEQAKILREHDDGKMWIHSGDLGKMDEDGILYIVGRLKRMIIRHDGFKVHPYKIEQVIVNHPAVNNCCVVGVRDVNHAQGELPIAHIILNEEFKGLEEQVLEDIKEKVKQQLPEYALPYNYQFDEKFPLTPIGKIDYLTLANKDANDNNLVKKKIR